MLTARFSSHTLPNAVGHPAASTTPSARRSVSRSNGGAASRARPGIAPHRGEHSRASQSTSASTAAARTGCVGCVGVVGIQLVGADVDGSVRTEVRDQRHVTGKRLRKLHEERRTRRVRDATCLRERATREVDTDGIDKIRNQQDAQRAR